MKRSLIIVAVACALLATAVGVRIVEATTVSDSLSWDYSSLHTNAVTSSALNLQSEEDGGDEGGDEGGGGDGSEAIPVDPRVGWGFASSQKGGYMGSGDGRLKVDVPAGASLEDLQLSYTPVDIWDATAPTCETYLGPPFDLHVRPFSGGQLVTSFQKPLTLMASFADVDTTWIDEESLYLARFDGSSWIELESSVDRSAREVRAQADRSGRYALIGESTKCPAGAPASVTQ